MPVPPLVLASSSSIRAALLTAAGIAFSTRAPKVDEDALRLALAAEGASLRDMADVLAEAKASKVAERAADACVIGADQVLECQGQVFTKPADHDAARAQLRALRGKTHMLYSAVVLYHENRPIWRHMGEARLTMRMFSEQFLDGYLDRNWETARHSVGCYQVEGEGIRLFSHIDGDHSTILGLPMLPLLVYLGDRGFIAT